ncbi:hypothetical protein [Paenibacillus graminis]|uniref:hypothetical protein n=1 Tax=Paenibacillus graminis TaxID=189425 RepID=UPI002DBA6E83|nr:hypothetical protein [Paenibacillus graminis]MEC0173024.1 hypothetical protein [Paenibacillus graminis]
MVKAQYDPVERSRLRGALNEKYRQQEDIVRKYGISSTEVEREIQDLIKELRKVDKSSVGNDRSESRPRNPKRLKVPWYCSNPNCDKTFPTNKEMIRFKKRHYCSEACALSDAGMDPVTITAKT